MIGVNFQPGLQDASQQSKPQGGTNTGGGIQEAIKVLSLRLPRVVGAQAVSPYGLLNSPGGGGSRVDSVVNQVLAKYFPQAAPMGMGPQQAYQGAQQPDFAQANYANPFGGGSQMPPTAPYGAPRVVVDLPQAPFTGGPPRPGQPTWDGGGGFPPSMIGELPPNFTPPTPPKRSPFPDYQDFGGPTPDSEYPRF